MSTKRDSKIKLNAKGRATTHQYVTNGKDAAKKKSDKARPKATNGKYACEAQRMTKLGCSKRQGCVRIAEDDEAQRLQTARMRAKCRG
jgi:hypothetical protein